MAKDEFKMNFFFDENSPTYEEIVMQAFEERLNEIIQNITRKIIPRY